MIQVLFTSRPRMLHVIDKFTAGVIALGSEVGLNSVLPTAFYEASMWYFHPSIMPPGADSLDIYNALRVNTRKLSTEDFERLSIGKDRLDRFFGAQLKDIREFVETEYKCKNVDCTGQLQAWWIRAERMLLDWRWEEVPVDPVVWMDFRRLAGQLPHECKLECGRCEYTISNLLYEKQQKMWEAIPDLFDLPIETPQNA